MGRGLADALIVEEPEPPQVDRELIWVIQDWRLSREAQIAPGFGNGMETAMAGRIGNTVTINGQVPDAVPVRAGSATSEPIIRRMEVKLVQRINVVYTTAFTKKPVSMRYRGIFDLVGRNRECSTMPAKSAAKALRDA